MSEQPCAPDPQNPLQPIRASAQAEASQQKTVADPAARPAGQAAAENAAPCATEINPADHPHAQKRSSKGWWIKMLLQPLLFLAAGVLLLLTLAGLQRLGLISAGGAAPVQPAGGSENARYVCPMMCTPPHSSPGRCPVCGMELVPATSGGSGGDELSIEISPAARRLANIATVAVKREAFKRQLRTIGSISCDEGRLATIAAYVDGRLERLYADYTGFYVPQGYPMALLYSPQLYAAQEEFLQAKQAVDHIQGTTLSSFVQTQHQLLDGSRQKLIELGMTDEQIERLKRSGQASSRIHICAPIGGTVIEKLAVEGQYVKEGQAIYRLADLSTVWLLLELFPDDAAAIRYGQRVEAEVQSLPGRQFVGRVVFVAPTVNEKTRTVGVRVVIPNEDGALRVGDYATATIQLDVLPGRNPREVQIYDPDLAGKWISPRHPHVIEDRPGKCRVCGCPLVPASDYGYADKPIENRGVLVVPRDAVLMAGNNSVLYVETQPGHFQVRPVVLGPVTENRAVILKGVKEGEHVACSGNFLLDSQMQLAGKPSLIDPRRAQAAAEKNGGPLELERVEIDQVAGEAGRRLEQLYEAYFAVQAALAADQLVAEPQARELFETATRLAGAPHLPAAAQSLARTVARHAQKLHKKDLDAQRIDFKPISKSIIRLAARWRGRQASTPFLHFYCPMVKGGQGDWLQAHQPLANPYWGSRMLRCGKLVHELPAEGPQPGQKQVARGGSKREQDRKAARR